jgi:hypothetical protein
MANKIKGINKPKAKSKKDKYLCTISFTTNKSFTSLFKDKKSLRVITLNNMTKGENNIFILQDASDIEANIGELELKCELSSKVEVNKSASTTGLDKLKVLEAEIKRLKRLLNKIKQAATLV